MKKHQKHTVNAGLSASEEETVRQPAEPVLAAPDNAAENKEQADGLNTADGNDGDFSESGESLPPAEDSKGRSSAGETEGIPAFPFSFDEEEILPAGLSQTAVRGQEDSARSSGTARPETAVLDEQAADRLQLAAEAKAEAVRAAEARIIAAREEVSRLDAARAASAYQDQVNSAEREQAASAEQERTAAQQSLDDAGSGQRRVAALIIKEFHGHGGKSLLFRKTASGQTEQSSAAESRPLEAGASAAASPAEPETDSNEAAAPSDPEAAGIPDNRIPDSGAEFEASVRKPVRAPLSQIVRPTQINPLEGSEIQAPNRPSPPAGRPSLSSSAAARAGVSLGKMVGQVRDSGMNAARNLAARKPAASQPQPKSASSQAAAAGVKARRFFEIRKPGLLLLVSALLQIVLQLVWQALPDGYLGLDKAGFSAAVLAAVLTQLFLVLLPCVLVIRFFKLPTEKLAGENQLTFPLGLLSFVLGVPAGLCLHALNNLLIYAAARLDIMIPEFIYPQISIPDQPALWPAAIIVFVLAPAIFEELLFRGIIQPEMARGGHVLPALFLSAIGFALFHNDPLFWMAPLGAGLILGILRGRTGSLYSPMLTHAAMNLSTIFISPLLPRFTSRLVLEYGSAGSSILYANLITAIIAGVMLIPLFILLGSLTEEPEELFSDKPAARPAAGRRQRVFFVSHEQKPADYSYLPPRESVSPLLDWLYWLACLVFLGFLASAYFISL